MKADVGTVQKAPADPKKSANPSSLLESPQASCIAGNLVAQLANPNPKRKKYQDIDVVSEYFGMRDYEYRTYPELPTSITTSDSHAPSVVEDMAASAEATLCSYQRFSFTVSDVWASQFCHEE